MVTIGKEVQVADGSYVTPATYYGLSTDSKPTQLVANGAAFIEMDSGKLYFFDAAGAQWTEWGGA